MIAMDNLRCGIYTIIFQEREQFIPRHVTKPLSSVIRRDNHAPCTVEGDCIYTDLLVSSIDNMYYVTQQDKHKLGLYPCLQQDILIIFWRKKL